jgi:hypothetical protein
LIMIGKHTDRCCCWGSAKGRRTGSDWGQV